MQHPAVFWINMGAATFNFGICYILWKKKMFLPIHWANAICAVISLTIAITRGVF